MSALATIIISIIILMAFHFAKDIYTQGKNVAAEGGMKQKYKILIEHFTAYPNAKIFQETKLSITMGVNGPSGSTIFDLTQTFGNVTIQYIVDNILFGKHKLEWEFPEDMDQKLMITRIDNDIEKYMMDIINKMGLSQPH